MKKNKILLTCAILMLILVFAFGSTFAQDKKVDLSKKYEKIIGRYHFEIPEQGRQLVVKFYVEDNQFWGMNEAQPQPVVFEQIEEKEFKFEADVGGGNVFILEFKKDDKGKYTKCTLINDFQGLEIEGTKIEEEKEKKKEEK